MAKVDMGDYIDVAARIAEFRDLYPEGSLQPFDSAKPYTIETIGDRTFVVYVAAAYRSSGDPRPGVGAAWEPFPGLTNFTRNSELQNAETSAWGRAIVAALAADTKRSVASAEEVRNRQAERDVPQLISPENVERMRQACEEAGVNVAEVVKAATGNRTEDPAQLLVTEIAAARDALRAQTSAPAEDQANRPEVGNGDGTQDRDSSGPGSRTRKAAK